MHRLQEVLGQRDTIIEILTPRVGANMAEMLPKMGDGSLFNLISACLAADTPGVSGELTIIIPRKPTDRLEVHWRSAPAS